MKHSLLLIFAFLIVFSTFSQNETQENTSTYYLIRHAEKDRSEEGVKNPHLTKKGLLRAQNWANSLKHIPFDAVYSTDYFRTKETAQPVANNKKLSITIYDPRNLDIDKFKEETKGKTIFVVGHSNSTPMFVNQLLGKEKYKHIDDRNNSNLYIVHLNNNYIFDSLLVIDKQ